ncbi:hypothetical protein [Paenibacillus sp. R14(2021)]|uniref:hypothetical protein n=1 Tax=Paenibacillus sp. R14(2021) TaxID=2859228 RepID=UPI001C613B8C|nr:hypothetical protein [Paenibacillus sp. R14(2021)]
MEEQIHTLILVTTEGINKCCRYKKIFRTKDQLILELIEGEVVHRMVVTQTEDGITDLMDVEGRIYRVLGISYRPNHHHADEEIYKYSIVDSYQNALNLNKFI